jgi:hypothetical protein
MVKGHRPNNKAACDVNAARRLLRYVFLIVLFSAVILLHHHLPIQHYSALFTAVFCRLTFCIVNDMLPWNASAHAFKGESVLHVQSCKMSVRVTT